MMSDMMTCKNKLCDGMKNGMQTVIRNDNVKGSNAAIFSWAIEYQCQICHAKYYSCKTCKNCGDIQLYFQGHVWHDTIKFITQMEGISTICIKVNVNLHW